MASVRDTVKRIPGARSAFYLAMALRQMAADQWRDPSSFDSIFSSQEDPWESSSESERERFAITLSMLDASKTDRFPVAVELGCAEGIFTERLAHCCDTLEGLDFSDVALQRARIRLGAWPGVTFRRWDMRTDPLAGSHDLVVAMGVLTSLYRPGDVKRMRDVIIGAMKPSGFLLFSDVRQSRVFEEAWWGRLLLRGGEQIRRLLARDPRLELIASADTKSHVFALYQRRR